MFLRSIIDYFPTEQRFVLTMLSVYFEAETQFLSISASRCEILGGL
jgi:hypothetical protein